MRWIRSPRLLPWLLALVFLLGLALRTIKLDKVPAHNETIDEYAWAWSGMTILREGVPRAWSYLPAYHVPWQKWRGWGYKIVRPWLDHPPLFSMVMGVWMVIGGYKDIFAVDLYWMRWMPWLLFIANFVVLLRLLPRFFDRSTMLVGLAFYAVSPLVVIDQKLVICENWLQLVYGLTHLALIRYQETGRRRFLVGTALGAAALPFSKIAALGYSLFLFVVAAMRGRRRLAALIAAATLVGLGGYFAWGAAYDWHQFLEVMKAQRNRWNGFGGAFELVFAHKMVSTKFLYYPFYIGAFMALWGAFSDEKTREYDLQYPIYLACMVFFVDQSQVWGWYLIPMYPVLCMGVGRFVVRMLERPDPRLLLTWIVFCVPYALDLLLQRAPLAASTLRWSYLAILLGGIGAACLLPRRVRLYTWSAGALVALQLVVDVQYVVLKQSPVVMK